MDKPQTGVFIEDDSEHGFYCEYWLEPKHKLAVYFELSDSADEDFGPDYAGAIKWDGCMNWQTTPGMLAHFCDPTHAVAFAADMKRVWQLAHRLMPEAIFDAETGE